MPTTPTNTNTAVITKKLKKKKEIKVHHCEQCPEKFSNFIHLSRHCGLTHENASQVCKVCAKTYPHKYALRLHMRNVHTETDLKCLICHRKFFEQFLLDRHTEQGNCEARQQIKREKEKLKIEICNSKVHHCKQCPKMFSKMSRLSRHLESTHEKESQVCEVCAKTFPYKDALRIHMRNAHTETYLKCLVCHKKFFQEELLDRHTEQGNCKHSEN